MRKAILSCILCMLLVGCNQSGSSTDNPAETVITLGVSSELSHLEQSMVKTLVDTVAESSGGSLLVEVVRTDTPLDSLDAGTELVLMTNEVAAMANGDFSAYTSPFYFSDYNHFAMTLGSEDFLEYTWEKTSSLLGAVPLGALYGGGYVLVNGREEPLVELEGFKDTRIILQKEPLMAYCIEDLGADVVQKEQEEILAGFNSQIYSTIECKKQALGQLQMPKRAKKIQVSESFHRVDIYWLMMSQTAAQTLSTAHMAAITEGVAAAIAENDQQILALEEESMAHIRAMPSTIEPINYTTFSGNAEESLKESARYSNIWNWDVYRYVRDLIK